MGEDTHVMVPDRKDKISKSLHLLRTSLILSSMELFFLGEHALEEAFALVSFCCNWLEVNDKE